MTLNAELRRLRKTDLPPFVEDPLRIPCVETSDPSRLCRHPVVSVSMITYNHEPYIRQAIEGVMMQKTDFEFELVVGEDCSSDKTREICFEYQKRYPDKIRVLWWHENVSRIGGNGNRTRARCRGEFIALCEGDDYWTDPNKLQKQVDVFRKYADVTFCCHRFLTLTDGGFEDWQSDRLGRLFGSGKCREGFLFDREEYLFPSVLSQTAAIMYRKTAYDAELVGRIGMMYDWVLCYVILAKGRGYFINETMSVYRCHPGGLWSSMSRLGQIRWSLSRAFRLFDADPTTDSRRQCDDWISRLRPCCFPYREFYLVRGWLGHVRRGLLSVPRLMKERKI